MSTPLLIGITGLSTILVLAGFAIAFLVADRKKERRIMRFSASDFHDLGTVSRNSIVKKDLKQVYRKVKYAVTSAANRGKFSTFVPIGNKLPLAYGEQFTALFLTPFIERLKKEGFAISYLPNGSMEMDSKDKVPAFSISWKDVTEQDDIAQEEKITDATA